MRGDKFLRKGYKELRKTQHETEVQLKRKSLIEISKRIVSKVSNNMAKHFHGGEEK